MPDGVLHISGDLRDDQAYPRLATMGFDVICQFLAYDTTTVQRDVDLFAGSCSQYVFISTASAYQKPYTGGPVTEALPLDNPYWAYSRSKAACEALLVEAADAGRLPVTIVRPSHTYRTRFPSTVVDGDHLTWRLLNDKPVVVHDTGQSVWTLTHAEDFARAFTRLLGNRAAIGGAYHITSDEAPTWNQIIRTVGETIGVLPEICAVPTSVLIEYNPDWQGPLLGDKANSMAFDNSSVRRAIGSWTCEVTLRDGLRRVHPHVQRRLESGYRPDAELDALIDRIVADWIAGTG